MHWNVKLGSVRVKHYRILYKVDDKRKEVRILRILYGGWDFERVLGDESEVQEKEQDEKIFPD